MRRGEQQVCGDDSLNVRSFRSSSLLRPVVFGVFALIVAVMSHLLTPSQASASTEPRGAGAAIARLASADAAAAACDGYVFVGVRGSGEADLGEADPYLGMGATVFDAFQSFALAMTTSSAAVAAIGLDYPAVAMNSFEGFNAVNGTSAAYTASVTAGAGALRDLIRARHDTCAGTRFVLSGYSQGADVLAAGIELLTAEESAMIVSTVLFGDPRFNAEDTGAARGVYDPDHFGAFGPRSPWETLLSSPVASYCQSGDAICGISSRSDSSTDYTPDFVFVGLIAAFQYGANVTGAHESYVTSGDTSRAGTRLAAALGGEAVVSESSDEALTASAAEASLS
jgi:phosphoheptose isomerase